MREENQKSAFSRNLLKYMNAKEITQSELSVAIGESKQKVNNWCRGRAIPLNPTLKKLSEYFDVTINDLLEDKANISIIGNGIGNIIKRMDSIDEKLIHHYSKLDTEKRKMLADIAATMDKKKE